MAKTISAVFTGKELDAVLNALHEAADARENQSVTREELDSPRVRLDRAVARFYRRIANDVEDARESAARH